MVVERSGVAVVELVGLIVDVGASWNDLDSIGAIVPSFNGLICTNSILVSPLFDRPDVTPRILNCASIPLMRKRINSSIIDGLKIEYE